MITSRWRKEPQHQQQRYWPRCNFSSRWISSCYWGQTTLTYVSERDNHWFKLWLIACSAVSNHLNQWRIITNCNTLWTELKETLINMQTFSKKIPLNMSSPNLFQAPVCNFICMHVKGCGGTNTINLPTILLSHSHAAASPITQSDSRIQ